MTEEQTRNQHTSWYYPDKISVEDFVVHLQQNLPAFKRNMWKVSPQEKYMEEWFQIFKQWMELE